MSLTSILDDARSTLNVPVSADSRALRRGYREQVMAHPPDRDPEGFRRVREAFELLGSPLESLRQRLLRFEPLLPVPSAPVVELPEGRGAVLCALVRHVVGQLDAEVCLAQLEADLAIESSARKRAAVKGEASQRKRGKRHQPAASISAEGPEGSAQSRSPKASASSPEEIQHGQ